jgi:peroxisomal 2,4-dienoyl-CoA reductase
MAIELGPRGITSNVIAPGPIKGTEGMSRLAPAELIEIAERMVPVGRWGGVRDIAAATIYLFSHAGSFVNGSVLVVDGGAWRTKGGSPGDAFPYPDFILEGGEVEGVAGKKGDKAKI